MQDDDAVPGAPTQKKTADRLDDAIHRLVALSACTLLLCPGQLCRLRQCRRARGCIMTGRDGRPVCLEAAPPDFCALHAALQAETIRLFETIAFAPSTPVEPLSRDPDERELQEAAAAILHALLPRGILLDRFLARQRAQKALSGPPYAGADLVEYRDFMRFLAAKRIAPELKGFSPAACPALPDGSP